jgi:pyruvate dehydrogenase E1 component
VLVEKMNSTLDGEYQKLSVSTTGATSASTSSARTARLRKMVEHLSDDQLLKLRRGGHDYRKLYAAYKAGDRVHGRRRR